MRWRRRKTEAEDERRENLRRACAQLRDAEDELEEVRGRTSEITEIARTLRRLREENHFARLVRQALEGDR